MVEFCQKKKKKKKKKQKRMNIAAMRHSDPISNMKEDNPNIVLNG